MDAPYYCDFTKWSSSLDHLWKIQDETKRGFMFITSFHGRKNRKRSKTFFFASATADGDNTFNPRREQKVRFFCVVRTLSWSVCSELDKNPAVCFSADFSTQTRARGSFWPGFDDLRAFGWGRTEGNGGDWIRKEKTLNNIQWFMNITMIFNEYYNDIEWILQVISTILFKWIISLLIVIISDDEHFK